MADVDQEIETLRAELRAAHARFEGFVPIGLHDQIEHEWKDGDSRVEGLSVE